MEQLGLHRLRGLQHGRVPPGRLPLAHEGQDGARGQAHPRRSPLHPHQRDVRHLRADSRRQRHRLPRRPDQLRRQQRAVEHRPVLPRVSAQLHQRRLASSETTSRTPKSWTGSSPASWSTRRTRRTGPTTASSGSTRPTPGSMRSQREEHGQPRGGEEHAAPGRKRRSADPAGPAARVGHPLARRSPHPCGTRRSRIRAACSSS